MKQLVIALLLMLPMAATAQNNAWEKTATETAANNQKYLAGAVPEVDGHVVFETTLKAPGMTAAQIYDRLLDLMTQLTKTSNQFEQSHVSVANKEKGQIIANYQEWLVFKSSALVLDRTRLMYHLVADCRDGEATLRMMRIYFYYDEERNPTTYKAEEWINDKYGLNKKQTKLARVSGKFRRKTIDRKDYLFEKFQEFLNN